MITGERELIALTNKYQFIFLYGTGENSQILCRCLQQHRIKVSCFIADDVDERNRRIYGKKVIGFHRLKKYMGKSMVLLDELTISSSIIRKLKNSGFSYFVIHRRLFWHLSDQLMTTLEKKAYPMLKSDAKKILFLSSDNNCSSGAFLCLAELNEFLNKKYKIETLVVLPNPGSGEEILKEKGIKYIFIRSSDWTVGIHDPENLKTKAIKARNIAINERAIAMLVKLIKKEKFNLIHINTIYSYVGARAALLTHTKFVWHIREVLELNGNRKIWNEKRGYHLIGKANRIITVSTGVLGEYCDRIENGVMQTVYDGVEKDIFYQPEKQIFQDNTIVFLIIGGIFPFKGQKELVQACAFLAQKEHYCFELWVVGNGDRNYIQEIQNIADNSGINIIFYGRQDQVQDFYKKADIFFICSQFEAFGRVTIEAMLSGNLIIGTDTGATKELINDRKTGFLYHQGDVHDLEEKILYALEHQEESKRLAAAGREYAKENFTLEQNAKNIVNIYRQII